MQKDRGPSAASDTSAVMVFDSDDLTSSSSSLEILSRRLLAPLQKREKKLYYGTFLNRCSVYLWISGGKKQNKKRDTALAILKKQCFLLETKIFVMNKLLNNKKHPQILLK